MMNLTLRKYGMLLHGYLVSSVFCFYQIKSLSLSLFLYQLINPTSSKYLLTRLFRILAFQSTQYY